MRVIIDEAMVDDAFARGMDVVLLQLLTHAFSGRYAFAFSTDAALEKCLSIYDAARRERFASQLDAAILQAAKYYGTPLTVFVRAVQQSAWDGATPVLTLQDALALLNERLVILLEDEANDWAFLKAILAPEERAILCEHEQERWLEVVHGGGSKILPILRKRLKSPQQALRTFVMFDSDRMHPDELKPGWEPQVGKNDCHALKYEKALDKKYPNHYWRLARRFIESYMPLPELAKWAKKANKDEVYHGFASLDEPQRWYYNMKSGFVGDNEAAKKRQGILYASVPDAQRTSLATGFGKTLADHYAARKPDAEFVWDEKALMERDDAVPKLLRLL